MLNNQRSKAYALFLINACLWGFASPIAKEAYRFVSPFQFLFGRYLFAGLLFLPIYLIFLYKPSKTPLKTLLLLSFLGTPLTLLPLYIGLQYTTALEASILVATGPIFTIVAGHFFLHEHLTNREKFGVSIVLLGTLLLIIKPLILDGALMRVSLLGNLLITIGNLIWTAFIILSKKHTYDSSKLSVISYLISIPFFLFLVLLESPAVISPILLPGALWPILYMAIFGSIIAFWAHTTGQNILNASEAAIFTYLQPLFAFPLSYFWLHEPLSPILIVSLCIIAAGVYITETKTTTPSLRAPACR